MTYDRELNTERRVNPNEIADLLRDIRDSETTTKAFERQILIAIDQLRRDAKKQELTDEEHTFLKTLIAREKARAALRDAVTKHIIEKTAIISLFAIFAGLGLLLKDYISN